MVWSVSQREKYLWVMGKQRTGTRIFPFPPWNCVALSPWAPHFAESRDLLRCCRHWVVPSAQQRSLWALRGQAPASPRPCRVNAASHLFQKPCLVSWTQAGFPPVLPSLLKMLLACWQMRMETKARSDPLKTILPVSLGVLSLQGCLLICLGGVFHPLGHTGFLNSWMWADLFKKAFHIFKLKMALACYKAWSQWALLLHGDLLPRKHRPGFGWCNIHCR